MPRALFIHSYRFADQQQLKDLFSCMLVFVNYLRLPGQAGQKMPGNVDGNSQLKTTWVLNTH